MKLGKKVSRLVTLLMLLMLADVVYAVNVLLTLLGRKFILIHLTRSFVLLNFA